MDCETVDCAAVGVSINPTKKPGERTGSDFLFLICVKTILKISSEKVFVLAKSVLLSTPAIKRFFPIEDSVQVTEDEINSPCPLQKY